MYFSEHDYNKIAKNENKIINVDLFAQVYTSLIDFRK